MKIETIHVQPPVPSRNMDWCAIDADTYDADCDQDGFHSSSPIGWGATEQEAIDDLKLQLEEIDKFDSVQEAVSHFEQLGYAVSSTDARVMTRNDDEIVINPNANGKGVTISFPNAITPDLSPEQARYEERESAQRSE